MGRYGEIWGGMGDVGRCGEINREMCGDITEILQLTQAQERAGAVAGLGSANRELAASEVRIRVNVRARARVRYRELAASEVRVRVNVRVKVRVRSSTLTLTRLGLGH